MKKSLLAMMLAVVFAMAVPVSNTTTISMGYHQAHAAENTADGMKRLNLILKKLRDAMGSNVTAIIPMAGLPDTEQGIDAWVELYEDEDSGIAFYANVGSSY